MKYQIKSVILSNGDIELSSWFEPPNDSRFLHDIQKEIIHVYEGLKEESVRQSLIKQGWAPPKEVK